MNRSRDTSSRSAERQELLLRARAARELSYAPYSNFKMGAAVATDRGEICVGALVENVSLGLAMCAERVALFATVAQNAGRPRKLALVAKRTSGRLTYPCGACLQVALELGGPDLEILVADEKGTTESVRLGDITDKLPYKGDPAAARSQKH